MAGMCEPQRSKNWTHKEIRAMLDSISRHYTETEGRKNTEGNFKKKYAWNTVTEAVNSHSEEGVVRTPSQVKKKWMDLKSQARKDIHARSSLPPGGAPNPKEGEWTNAIHDIINCGPPVIVSITNGAESWVPQAQEEPILPVKLGVPIDLQDHSYQVVVTEDSDCADFDLMEEPSAARATHSPATSTDEPPPQQPSAGSSRPTQPSASNREEQPSTQPSAKRPRIDHDDLVNVERSRLILEQEKLKLEIEKLKSENLITRPRFIHEDLVSAEREKLLLEQEKLRLEIEKLKSENRILKVKEKMSARKAHLLELQIQLTEKEIGLAQHTTTDELS